MNETSFTLCHSSIILSFDMLNMYHYKFDEKKENGKKDNQQFSTLLRTIINTLLLFRNGNCLRCAVVCSPVWHRICVVIQHWDIRPRLMPAFVYECVCLCLSFYVCTGIVCNSMYTWNASNHFTLTD